MFINILAICQLLFKLKFITGKSKPAVTAEAVVIEANTHYSKFRIMIKKRFSEAEAMCSSLFHY